MLMRHTQQDYLRIVYLLGADNHEAEKSWFKQQSEPKTFKYVIMQNIEQIIRIKAVP